MYDLPAAGVAHEVEAESADAGDVQARVAAYGRLAAQRPQPAPKPKLSSKVKITVHRYKLHTELSRIFLCRKVIQHCDGDMRDWLI